MHNLNILYKDREIMFIKCDRYYVGHCDKKKIWNIVHINNAIQNENQISHNKI